ncbi:hypothetical protein K7887_18275 [Sutcliffiella horikoshii]|uniref:hypothetical protein n=1 Tax=Sutcliffiella horikoshii TaxID=79883 RepID=UPI001CC122FA|nr:hypothetical protein [Sutcliffiella horikoshii]UAL46791.1 hypothetical protein K7887_18275 [Sutcliffiella horikoshii]
MGAFIYSKYNLIEKEKAALEERNIFQIMINSLSEKRYKFEIRVPNDMYLRAQVLCDDIDQLCDSEKVFPQRDLVEHIFLDFLDEVRKNDSNVGAIYNRVTVRTQELPLVKDQPIIPTRSTTLVSTRIDKEDALRAEVLLEDLSYFFPKHELTVEKLIEIVYLDFLLEYMKGRRKNVIADILEYVS